MSAPQLIENFFRHEYGRLVAVLSRRFGVHHLELIEDAAQSALMTALETWRVGGLPDHPSAWVYRVAHNNLVSVLRQDSRRKTLAQQHLPRDFDAYEPSDPALNQEVADDLLRMLFVCCDERIAAESQLVLALKILAGFGVKEIALRLFTSEANVYKRYTRGKARLQHDPLLLESLTPEQCALRRPAVLKGLYLLFTEGHLSAHQDEAIRRELCDEAIRLTTLLADSPFGDDPEVDALLALMFFHRARLASRQSSAGDLLLLEEQDRSLWDRHDIERGLVWLNRSARGDAYSRFHAEAGIAAAHCMAPTFADTPWPQIADGYELLERVAPSPLHRLNRALAVAEYEGPQAGLEILASLTPPTWLSGSYLWSVALADLHRRAEHRVQAHQHYEAALRLAPSPAIATLIRRRLAPVVADLDSTQGPSTDKSDD